MSQQTPFEQQWQQQQVEFKLPPVATSQLLCPYAQAFDAWCHKLLSELGAHPTDIQVNLAQLYLQTKFFGWYAAAPAACRRHLGSPKNKVHCLFEIYQACFFRLRDLELALNPPRLREPAPPSRPPAPAPLLGITLGEVLGEAV